MEDQSPYPLHARTAITLSALEPYKSHTLNQTTVVRPAITDRQCNVTYCSNAKAKAMLSVEDSVDRLLCDVDSPSCLLKTVDRLLCYICCLLKTVD